jgi:hypothetical protein
MFCRFGSVEDIRPVVVAAIEKLVCTLSPASTWPTSASA